MLLPPMILSFDVLHTGTFLHIFSTHHPQPQPPHTNRLIYIDTYVFESNTAFMGDQGSGRHKGRGMSHHEYSAKRPFLSSGMCPNVAPTTLSSPTSSLVRNGTIHDDTDRIEQEERKKRQNRVGGGTSDYTSVGSLHHRAPFPCRTGLSRRRVVTSLDDCVASSGVSSGSSSHDGSSLGLFSNHYDNNNITRRPWQQ